MSKVKKVFLIIFIVIFSLLLLLLIAGLLGMKNNKEKTLDVMFSNIEKTYKPNTSEAVDYLANVAKTDAENGTGKQVYEAIDYIKSIYPNFYSDNATMEKIMYYGYFIQYVYDTKGKINDLGTDVYQSVKYVYRNEESADSESTKSNLEEIKKDLEALE